MGWRRLMIALLASSALILLGFGLNGCVEDSTDDPLVEEHSHDEDETFNGTFAGSLTKTQNTVESVTETTMDLTVESPLSGVLTLGTATGSIVGNAEADSATFSAAFSGDCPGTTSGSLALTDEDETLEVDAIGQDCLGVFTLSGTLQREAGRPWEWAGVFALVAPETYTWIAQQVDGAYAAPTMLVAMIETSEASLVGIEAAEAQAEALFSGTAQDIAAGGTVTVGTLYRLVFDQQSTETRFGLVVPADGAYVIFTEHVPTEFEDTEHYLQTAAGEEVFPAAEASEEGGGGHDHDHSHDG